MTRNARYPLNAALSIAAIVGLTACGSADEAWSLCNDASDVIEANTFADIGFRSDIVVINLVTPDAWHEFDDLLASVEANVEAVAVSDAARAISRATQELGPTPSSESDAIRKGGQFTLLVITDAEVRQSALVLDEYASESCDVALFGLSAG